MECLKVGGFPGQRISLDISSFGETGTLTYAIWRFQQVKREGE